MLVELNIIELPDSGYAEVVPIRALSLDGKCLAINSLDEFRKSKPDDYKKIMKALSLIRRQQRVRNPNHVKKCQNRLYPDVYEARAHGGLARLMFFYHRDNSGREIAVFTNSFWKNRGDQNQAFTRCDGFRHLFLQYYGK